jgi:hypothetical protein
LIYTGFEMESKFTADAGLAVAVGIAPALFAGSVGSIAGVDWSTVCPLLGWE